MDVASLPITIAGEVGRNLASAILRVPVAPRIEGIEIHFDTPAGDLEEARRIALAASEHARKERARLGTAWIESTGRPERFSCGTVYRRHANTGEQDRIEYEVRRYQLAVISRGPGAAGYEVRREPFWLPPGIRLEGPIEAGGEQTTIRLVRESDGAAEEIPVP